ncbi:MAG: NnrS family protein [Gammaproteobacteria bacterium]|nr:NnrS family protein [Gammaproteobacteria bacterium]
MLSEQSPRKALAVLRVLAAAPHRMLFLPGAVQLLVVMLVWLIELGGRSAGLGPVWQWSLPAGQAHAFLMIYGVFPFFIFGFLFTVYPRWMSGPPLPAGQYSAVAALLVAGWLLFYAGLLTSRVLAAVAVLMILAGWLAAFAALWRVYRRAETRGPHERLLNLALLFGTLGVALFGYGLVTDTAAVYSLVRELGLWLFLLPVVFLVSHRMIPFFSQSALANYLMVRPVWGPPLMLVCTAAHALLDLAGLPQWRFLADLPLAAAAWQHSYVWQFRRSFHARLLAMLHIAFLWLGIGMTLYSVQSLWLLATGTDFLGRAPLHALGIGFFAGMIAAMASRVTLGHSGRSLIADRLTWAVLLGVNVTALVRIAAELSPAHSALLNTAAALAWLLVFTPWVWHYAPMYLRPRVDRKPG